MIYTETEKKELDEVRRVFAEHLRQCPDYELLIPAAGSSRRKTSAGSAWRASEWTPYISPTTTTGWRTPILWSAPRSAGAGNPLWINSRSSPISAGRSSRKRTNVKACRLPHEGQPAGFS